MVKAKESIICRREEILRSCVRRKWSKEVSAARGIEIGVSYTPSGKRLARLERARLACRRYSSSEMGLRLKDSRDRTQERISEKDILIGLLGEHLRSPQESREKSVEKIFVVGIRKKGMEFTNRDKEGFSLGTKGGVKLIVVREVRKITALGDLCDDIREDNVVEERIPRERHTVEVASSSVLFLFVEFVESSIHCGVEVL
nr:MAG TPA: hypothetical protein [Caudoviricetes sp.]